ncbi:MAG: putative membrane protein YqiK, partial [Myxococcota bacterium]
MIWGVLGSVIAGIVLLLLGILAFFAKYYQRVEQGKALIVTKKGGAEVSFTTSFVLPLFHRMEFMDISVKTIEIAREGKDGLICRDNIRADIKVTFFVRVNPVQEDVLKVASNIGCTRASHQGTLEELFIAKFSEALKTVGKNLDFEDLYTRRDDFKDDIVKVIGKYLNGYVLEDVAIDYLEQTPMSSLDTNNILDAQGIRKITELTAIQHVATNNARRDEEKRIKVKDVETVEQILEQDKRQAEAVARQKREIANIQAKEAATVAEVQAQEKLKAEEARIKSDETIRVKKENMERQVEVAGKNRERVVGIEEERVQKDRQLEAISRERETELARIAKEKALEFEKKEIADIIRQRIEVERAVAQEEELIKEIRVVEEAKRSKAAVVIAAEAKADEAAVQTVKHAEASEAAARHEARRQIQLAEAAMEASDKQASAKIRLSEGVQAEEAA